MPLPVIGGLGLKLSLFFAKRWVKFALVAMAIAALLWLGWRIVDAVKDWNTATYNSGFAAGSAEREKHWQSASAANARLRLDQLVRDAEAQNKSVLGYLGDIAARKPGVDRVEREIIRYAQSPAGAMRCINHVGVRLLLDGRETLSLNGQAVPATGTPGPIQPTMRTIPAPIRVRDSSGRAVLYDGGASPPKPVEQ